MIKMQDKILNEIERIAKKYELEAVISYAANNTGHVYIMDDFKHVCVYTFNFQTSYCSIEFYHGGNEILNKNIVKEGSRIHLGYYKDFELNKIFDFLDYYLREHDMEKNL